MTITVKIISTDFIPLIDSYKFVFVFYCVSTAGRQYNIEEFDTKTALCNKYGIQDLNFVDWDSRIFKGLDIEIKVRRWAKNKFIRFLANDTAKRVHLPLYPVADMKQLEQVG